MSNPFAPPGPQHQPAGGPYGQPAGQPQPGQPWGQPQPGQPQPGQPQPGQPQFPPPFQQGPYGGQGQAWAPQQPFAPAPKQGNGLAITAVVLGGLALLGVLGLAAFMGVGVATAPSFVLEGSVTVVDKGVQGPVLEQALRSTIEDDGSYVGEIVCPVRSQVGQGLVSVCHGSVDDWDWTGVVVFEDDTGSFIVNQL